MILSFKSAFGEDIYNGNWGAIAGSDSLRPIEECFIDLRILDAVVSVSDIVRAFGTRLASPIKGDPDGRYVLGASEGASMRLTIAFRFSNGEVSDVDVRSDFVRNGGGYNL